jgi:hypothetical protein
MRKWIGWLAALALFGVAWATGNGNQHVWVVSGDGDDSVAVNETITVKIPVRYALHLTESSWELDLANPPEAAADYVFNPNDPVPPGEGCYLVPKKVKNIDDLVDYAQAGGVFKPIGTYPAIKDFNDDGAIDENEKGTLICVNHKLLQKFSKDPDGWELLVAVTGPSDGFGYFGMADILPFGPGGYFYTDSLPVSDQQIASGSGPTGGWLDDRIIEAFWFDGSEAAGTHQFTVTFTLAGL